jgi:hypothetical protein
LNRLARSWRTRRQGGRGVWPTNGKQASSGFPGPRKSRNGHLRSVLEGMGLNGGKKLALNGPKGGRREYTRCFRLGRMEILVNYRARTG